MRTIVIDGREMTSRTEVHVYLAKRLSLPDYYGRNLDALHDCLCDISKPTNLIVYRRDELELALGSYAASILQIFTLAADENSFLTISFDNASDPSAEVSQKK